MTETASAADLRGELLSKSHIFAAALRKVFQEEVMKEVAGETVTFSQFKLLYLVARTEGRSIGDAAALLGVSNAAASKAVDKLVRRRLLRRTETEADRRSSQLSLTETSRRLLEKYEVARNRKMAEIFQEFSAKELEQWTELLVRLASAIVGHSVDQDQLRLQCSIYERHVGERDEIPQRPKAEKLHRSEPHRNGST